jgi:CBS domain containing-hemolysin-like protein
MISAIVVILVCLFFSAFFSGMEIAFTSSNKLKLQIEKKRSPVFERIISLFLRNPGQYITTILVGNNIALVVYSLFMTQLLNRFMGVHTTGWGVLLQTLAATAVIIFVGEFIPKSLVRGNPNFFMRTLAVPIYLIYIVLWPVARFTTWLSVLLLRLLGQKIKRGQHVESFDRVELEHLVGEAAEGDEVEIETKLFQNAMDFRDVSVRDCMVPRVDIEAVNVEDGIEHLVGRFVETKYSRIFVYEESIDNIIGYVNTKSLFKEPKTIREVLRGVDYGPESLPAQSVLELFTRKNMAIAVVVDEFGGTAGIVSMEDVLEEIFGEIEDEHDSPDLIEKVEKDGSYVLSGRLEVDYLNEKYNLGIPESEDYDTLAGWVIFYHEGIPSRGEVFDIGGMEVRVLKVDNSKLELVRIMPQIHNS